MPDLKTIKKMENVAFTRVSRRCSTVGFRFSSSIKKLNVFGRQKLTIMFIPHSEKRILNFQLSFFGLAGILGGLGLAVFLFVFSAARFSDTNRRLQTRSDDLKTTQGDLDAFRDKTGRLMTAARRFETALAGTLTKIGAQPSSPDSAIQRGDLASFFETGAAGSGSIREISELDRITDFLEKSVDPVKDIGALLSNQSAVLTEIPNIWPIKGGIGHISMQYGQNVNPFTGQWYVHKGIDISTFRSGDPIVATADGKIVAVGFDSGFGNYVIIKHSHGFFTRYAHMQSFRVYSGQKVQQGQVIGYIGNTGLSTGPHCHYEVHLGTGVINPAKFLNFKNSASYMEADKND